MTTPVTQMAAPGRGVARSARRTDPQRLGAPRIVAVVLLSLMAIGIGVLRYLATADDGYLTEAERLLGSVAFEGVVLAPALLALVSARRRAVLLIPAAIALTPVAMLSFTGVLFPVLIPVVLLWVALATRWDGLPCGPVRGCLAIPVVLVLLVGAVAALFVHPDAREFTSADGLTGGSTSDVLTVGESMISLGLVATAFVVGTLLTTPSRRRRANRR